MLVTIADAAAAVIAVAVLLPVILNAVVIDGCMMLC